MAVSKQYLEFLRKSFDPQRLERLLGEMEELHHRKNSGYVGTDNPDAWANFRESEKFGVIAFTGCLVRASDKWKRIINILRKPDDEKVGESVIDTLKDLAAYCLIACCLYLENEKIVLEFYNSVRKWYDGQND